MRDLEKDVVPFVPNFDNRRKEPSVLPSRFPNLLVNGSVGIAVGMATYVPPHNLGEVIDATIFRMDNPESTVPELMEYIKGPDFPTAATIYGMNGILEAYTTGKGRIMVRAKAHIEEEKHRIIFTEIPYQVNKAHLCETIGDLVKDKRIEGITNVNDESGRHGMRIVVDYKKDANGQIILNQLYKYTQLQDTCPVNMLAIVNGEPKVLSLPQILDHYIRHQEEVIVRRTRFDLAKAKARAHILEGYKIAMDNIDEIVQIMKTSPSIPESKRILCERFGLDDVQAQAIVEMTLGKLTGLERQKVEDELARLHALIEELEAILADMNKVRDIVKKEMLEIRDKYADERRTEIIPVEEEIVAEDLIEKHNCIITMTHAGYFKRQPADTYSAQRRGGKGIIGMGTKEEDYIERVVSVHSHSFLMLFTNRGRVQSVKAYRINEASRTAKGSNIVNIIDMNEGEKVTAMISVPDFEGEDYLMMVTRMGVIKRTRLSEFAYQRKGGKIAIDLDEGDELLSVHHTTGHDDLIIATHNGMAVRFSEENVRCMGRGARGVRGITLRENDYVVGVTLVDDEKKLLTVTEKGYGKRVDFEDFRQMKTRGGFGVTCHNISDKTGYLTGINTVAEEDDLMMITDEGMIVRTHASEIPVYSRSASGVIVMRTQKDQRIVNFTLIEKSEEEEEMEEAVEETAEAEE